MDSKSYHKFFQLRILLPLLCLAVIAVYSPHLSNGLVFDDHPQIENNPLVTGELPWTSAFTQGIWAHMAKETGARDIFYRPLVTIVHRLAFQAGNGAPWAFHLLSLGLHLIATSLAAVVLRRLNFRPMEALAGAALFALHPLAGEVVYWAVSTGELLAQIGLLVTVFMTLAASRGRLLHWTLYQLGAISGLAIGLLAKETAIIIAPLLTLEAFRHPRQELARRLLPVTPLWLVTLGYFWVRSQMVTTALGKPLPDGISNVGSFGLGLIWYFKQFLFPFPLTSVHDFPADPTGWQVVLGVSGLVLAITIFALLCIYRREGLFWYGWLVFPLLLAQAPTLFSLKFVTGTPVAERYMFLPLVPWCALLVIGCKYLLVKGIPETKRQIAGGSMCLIACMVGGFLSYDYGKAYRDDTAFFQRAYAYAPGNPHVLMWLANLQRRQNHYDSALILLDKVMSINPEMPFLYMNRGLVLAKMRRLPEAANAFQQALQQNPAQIGAHYELANVLRDLGQIDEAIYHYKEELKLNTNSVAAMSGLGLCLYSKADIIGAVEIWEQALRVSGLPSIHFNLGMAYRQLGQLALAEMHLRRFLREADESYAGQRIIAQQWLGEQNR